MPKFRQLFAFDLDPESTVAKRRLIRRVCPAARREAERLGIVGDHEAMRYVAAHGGENLQLKAVRSEAAHRDGRVLAAKIRAALPVSFPSHAMH